MADPITYQNVRRRFQMPPREPASAAEGIPVADRLDLAKEEGRTPVLNPEELAEMTYEAMQREMSPQTAGLLPSRGPVDDPARLLQEPTGPAYDPAADSPILELMQPGIPAMERPPTLHTPEELAAGLEGPGGPPTISRTPEPRGEAAGPAVGQGNSALQMLAKIAGFALPALDAAARGAAAGERSGSFLGGFGAASQAEEQRQMRNRDFETGQRQQAAQTEAVEQRTEMLPEQLEIQRRNQEILQFRAEQQARYMETLTQQIAQQRKLKPQELRRDQLNIIARMARDKANEETDKELMRMRLAQSPEEAELLRANIEAQHELANQRRASSAFDRARTAEVGKSEPEDVNARMRNAATLLNAITRIENDLIGRHTKTDQRVGSPTRYQDIFDVNAMQGDPQYLRLQKLQSHYDAVVAGAQPETVSGNAPQGSRSPLNFDPNRIRQGVLQRMGAGGAR